MESFFQALQRFGIGRLTAILGAGAGVAAVLASVLLHVGAQPESLLYSNLDLKEAQQITADLDQAGIKYQLKGDGSTVMVDRDSVDKARLLLAGKGLPTAGSVGYEIFDNAPTLGQTEFVQNLDQQRALEGELARTIMKERGIASARVHLVIPKREPFTDERFAVALNRLVERLAHITAKEPMAYWDRLAVKSGDRIRFVATEEIEWIEGAGVYVTLHSAGEAIAHRISLTTLSEKLDPGRFIRVHRSAIVNIGRILHLEPLGHGEFDAVLKGGDRVKVSRSYRAVLEARLGQNL